MLWVRLISAEQEDQVLISAGQQALIMLHMVPGTGETVMNPRDSPLSRNFKWWATGEMVY